MAEDPLQWFAHEKVAEDSAPSFAMEEEYKIPQMLSKSSLDPGERALAAVAAVSGSLATTIAPMIGRIAVSGPMERGSVSWKGAPPLQNVESIAHAFSVGGAPGAPLGTKGSIMGLFNVEGRPRANPGLMSPEAAHKFEQKYIAKLREIQPVVDSFIDKHKLTEKGVRINIQHGPLSGKGGGGFSLANKQVFLPRVGKELALHELGHAADYTGRFGSLRRFAEPALKRGVMVALPVALAAGDRIKEMIPGTIDDKAISFMQNNAPEIMGATLAATSLFPEAKASFLAVSHLRDLEKAGKQPAGTALAAAKKLAPFWGTYLIGAIPAIVGMSLARKYMRDARHEKGELQEDIEKQIQEVEKNASFVGDWISHAKDLGHITKQIGKGTTKLVTDKGTIRQISQAAKHTGSSPEFIWGAVTSALPATMGALYMYGTPGGELIRDRLDMKAQTALLGHGPKQVPGIAGKDEVWRKENPLRFAGLVAMGAALSGGIMSKFIHDLTKVL